MKILVPVKRVVDYNVRVHPTADGKKIATDGLKMSMNPFDETAVEEAVRLKERSKADEIVIVAIGPTEAQETIRTALAMGADRGILIEAEGPVEPRMAAKLLREVCRMENPDLVIAGKQAIDDDAGQTGPMLAMLMGWGQAVAASRLALETGEAVVACETDTGTKTVALKLPAVVTADLRLNEPRYVSLANVMRARKKPLAIKRPSDYGVEAATDLEVCSLREPPLRKSGVMVESAGAFLAALRGTGGLK
jgi:electron transfer flavoprotein beta subunit